MHCLCFGNGLELSQISDVFDWDRNQLHAMSAGATSKHQSSYQGVGAPYRDFGRRSSDRIAGFGVSSVQCRVIKGFSHSHELCEQPFVLCCSNFLEMDCMAEALEQPLGTPPVMDGMANFPQYGTSRHLLGCHISHTVVFARSCTCFLKRGESQCTQSYQTNEASCKPNVSNTEFIAEVIANACHASADRGA
jgi:hypothetical protein